MKDRIKIIIQKAGVTQATFAERIGIQQSAVSMWLSGKREPTEAIKKLICSEYGISRRWLETGEGEMRDPQRTSDIELLAQAATGQCEAKKIILRAVASMPDDLLVKILEYLNEAQKKSQA